MINGLPPLDVPLHERDPRPCKSCTHSFFDGRDAELRYMRCGRSDWSQQCRFERHDTGDCKPEGIYFKERGA